MVFIIGKCCRGKVFRFGSRCFGFVFPVVFCTCVVYHICIIAFVCDIVRITFSVFTRKNNFIFIDNQFTFSKSNTLFCLVFSIELPYKTIRLADIKGHFREIFSAFTRVILAFCGIKLIVGLIRAENETELYTVFYGNTSRIACTGCYQ